MARKSQKVYVDFKDSSRILFTEVLPYELPVIFSNQRLYTFSKDRSKAPHFIKLILEEKRDFTIPFEYNVLQGVSKRRSLYLIHPALQLKFIPFYQNYSQIILSLCSRSSYSLRRPSKISSYFYDKHNVVDDSLKTNTVDQEPDPFGSEGTHSSSYFYYSKYSHLYKFIDSQEWLELERRFSFAIRTDISKFFPSIYTHTISWAVKGKEFAKEHKDGFSFESQFDKLMQDCNYKETNGIVIGPEFSRIFSEIILQSIDLRLERRLDEEGLSKNDYAVRRFVDDYFIFAKREDISRVIFRLLEQCLKEYKLYLNEYKTEDLQLPFITPQTISKTDVINYLKTNIFLWLNTFKSKCFSTDVDFEKDSLDKLKYPFKSSVEIIRDLKIAVKKNEQDLSIVAGSALSHLTRSLFSLHKTLDSRISPLEEEDLELLQNLLLISIEVVFFFYPMDFRVRTTYLVAQFMLILSRISKFDSSVNEYVVTNIQNHVVRLIERFSGDQQGLEILNLIVSLREIYPHDRLDKAFLARILSPKYKNEVFDPEDLKKASYFDYICVLFYCREDQEYLEVRNMAIEGAKSKIINGNIIDSSEITHLFFDFVSCPWIEESTRKDVIGYVYEKFHNKYPSIPDLNQIFNYCNENLGFVNWKMEIGIEKVLLKKELSPVY